MCRVLYIMVSVIYGWIPLKCIACNVANVTIGFSLLKWIYHSSNSSLCWRCYVFSTWSNDPLQGHFPSECLIYFEVFWKLIHHSVLFKQNLTSFFILIWEKFLKVVFLENQIQLKVLNIKLKMRISVIF